MANFAFSDLAESTALADEDLFMITDDSESVSEKSKHITFRTLEKRLCPPGTIIPCGMGSAPTGWLECDGSAVSRTSYADLFSAIGTNYGYGNNSTTFNLPDFRGRFLRSWDHGAGNDPDAASRTANNTGGNTGDNVGSEQDEDFLAHTHPTSKLGFDGIGPIEGGNNYSEFNSTSSAGGNETRPKNVNVMYCIKY